MLQIRDISESTQQHGHYGVFETVNTKRVAFVKKLKARWKATIWTEGRPIAERHYLDLDRALSWAREEVS